MRILSLITVELLIAVGSEVIEHPCLLLQVWKYSFVHISDFLRSNSCCYTNNNDDTQKSTRAGKEFETEAHFSRLVYFL